MILTRTPRGFVKNLIPTEIFHPFKMKIYIYIYTNGSKSHNSDIENEFLRKI